jgi:hypothetical protein
MWPFSHNPVFKASFPTPPASSLDHFLKHLP